VIKFIASTALLGLLAGATGQEAEERRLDLSPPRAEIAWLTDYSLAQEKALLTRRPVLLTFYTTWCGWCRRLEATTFHDPDFARLTRSLVAVRVNGEVEKGLAGLFRVGSYPTTVVLDRRGKELGRIRGYYPADRFVPMVLGSLGGREPYEEVRREADAHPEDPDRLYALADVEIALERYEEARRTLARLVELDPGNRSGLLDDAGLDLAIIQLLDLDFPGSLVLFDRFFAEHAESERRYEGMFFHGIALVRSGERDRGLARLEEAAAGGSFRYIEYESSRIRSKEKEGGESG
jgi:thioredoxin-related protein